MLGASMFCSRRPHRYEIPGSGILFRLSPLSPKPTYYAPTARLLGLNMRLAGLHEPRASTAEAHAREWLFEGVVYATVKHSRRPKVGNPPSSTLKNKSNV